MNRLSLNDDDKKQEVDWQFVLADFIKSLVRMDYSFIPPNRRYIGMGIYLPSCREQPVEIVVALDTSGTISKKEMALFLNEVQEILDWEPRLTLHVIQCDTKVQNYEVLTVYNRLDGLLIPEITGHQGNDFRAVFNFIKDESLRVDGLVYLTDGKGEFPNQAPDYPVLWVLTTDIKPPFGEYVKMKT